jgi:hypothetical protein
VLSIHTEKNNTNASFFDGVFSRNETITLRSNLLSLPNSNGDQQQINTYNVLNRNNDKQEGQADTIYNKTAPILCLVSDSFFIFSSNRRTMYKTTLTRNKTFSRKYPQIYGLLVNSITRR